MFGSVVCVLDQKTWSPSSRLPSDHSSWADIEMHPLGILLNEMPQKCCSLTCRSFSLTWAVGEISVLWSYQVLMIVITGQMPWFLMHFFTKSSKHLDDVLVVGEKARVVGAQCCSNGSSECGKFDKHIHVVLLLGPIHAVSKHQPSFCVSVSNLNWKSLSTNDDIGRPVCVLVDWVLNESDAACQVYWHFLFDYCLESRKDVHGSALVQKHMKHSSSWIWQFVPVLMSKPPVSKQTPLPT